METLILALCFFTSVAVNIGLMVAFIGKRQRTSLEFSGQTLQVSLHQGNVHLITGLVLYEKGRHDEAVAMLQEAIRHDPQDMMADAMLQIALNAGPAFRVKGLAPASQRRLASRTESHVMPEIIDAEVRELTSGDEPLAESALALSESSARPISLPFETKAARAVPPRAMAASETPVVAAPAAVQVSTDPPATQSPLLSGDDGALANAVKDGLTLVREGHFDRALVHFEALMATHPQSRIARTGLAIALKHAGRGDEAAEVLRAALVQEAAVTGTGPAAST
ncbi:MAG: tetratricopeptide repeat protein [Candidatus Sericytochromatia bacterium]|nr:tetratricopeptide repeat protein [Candidatus Sericytochromatia bacterium]